MKKSEYENLNARYKEIEPYMARAQAGDQRALETGGTLLYPLMRSYVMVQALRAGLPPDQASDILQESMLGVVRSLSSWDGRSFQGWSCAIARNKIIDQLRANTRHRHDEFSEYNTGAGSDSGYRALEARQVLSDAFGQVKLHHPEVAGPYLLGDVASQMAPRFGTQQTAVRVQINRDMKRLRAHIAGLERE